MKVFFKQRMKVLRKTELNYCLFLKKHYTHLMLQQFGLYILDIGKLSVRHSCIPFPPTELLFKSNFHKRPFDSFHSLQNTPRTISNHLKDTPQQRQVVEMQTTSRCIRALGQNSPEMAVYYTSIRTNDIWGQARQLPPEFHYLISVSL